MKGVYSSIGAANFNKFGPMDIPGCQVHQRAASFILMLNATCAAMGRGLGRNQTFSSLDTGLLVHAEDIIPRTKGFAIPYTMVEIQDRASLLGELRVSGPNPAPVTPWSDGVLN